MTTNREMTDKEFPVMQYEDAGKEAYAEQRVIFFRADPTLDKLSAHPDGHYERITDAAPSVEHPPAWLLTNSKPEDHLLPMVSPIAEPAKAEQVAAVLDKWSGVLSDPRMDDNCAAPQPVIDDAQVVEIKEQAGTVRRLDSRFYCTINGKLYVRWEYAGGPEQCKHGYARCFACPECEKVLLAYPTPTVIPDVKGEGEPLILCPSKSHDDETCICTPAVRKAIKRFKDKLAESKPLPSEPAEGEREKFNQWLAIYRETPEAMMADSSDEWAWDAWKAAKAEKVKESHCGFNEGVEAAAAHVLQASYFGASKIAKAIRELKKRSVGGVK